MLQYFCLSLSLNTYMYSSHLNVDLLVSSTYIFWFITLFYLAVVWLFRVAGWKPALCWWVSSLDCQLGSWLSLLVKVVSEFPYFWQHVDSYKIPQERFSQNKFPHLLKKVALFVWLSTENFKSVAQIEASLKMYDKTFMTWQQLFSKVVRPSPCYI